jgi:hypothetical protein
VPHSFDISADYAGSVEDVYRAFCEPDYWRERLVYSAVDEWDVEGMRVGGESGDDGTVEVELLQVMHTLHLPALVTQLHRGDLKFRRTEKWGPLEGGAAKGTLGGAIAGAPVSLAGTGELFAAETGARLQFVVDVSVRIPIIGGKVERLVGAQLPKVLDAERQFTDAWITEHARDI